MKTGRRVKLGKVLIFVVLFAAFLSVGCASAATTYTVCSNGCNHTSIQAAINVACPSDTVEVHSGIYYENVDVNKQLILRGVDTGSGKPVVDAGGSGSAVTLSADGITLDRFVANNSEGWLTAGIKVTSSNNTITCIDVTNSADGIYLQYSNNNTITCNNVSNNWDGIYLLSSCNNTITCNTATKNRYGLFFYDSAANTLRDNLMSDNSNNFKILRDSYHFINDIDTSNLVDGKPIYYLVDVSGTIIDSSSNAGIVYCINGDSITVKDLNLSNNGCGIYFYNTDNSSIQNNNISNNDDGLFLDNSCNNTITDNNVCNNDYYGVYLTSSCNNTITNNNASNNFYGIHLDNSCNSNTITSNNVSNNEEGIHLYTSNNNVITGNTATNNSRGLYFYGSGGNSLRNNLMSGNRYNFGVGSIGSATFNNDIDTSNLVDGKPIYYLVGASGTVIDSSSNAGTVYCINCDRITVKNLPLSNNGCGIHFYNTDNSSIQNNSISNNGKGIYIGNSSNNTITGNNVSNNRGGIFLDNSCNNIITNNNVSNSSDGIFLDNSCNNIITNNNVSNNTGWGAIRLSSSCYNSITGNNVSNNRGGIYLRHSNNNNKIYLNNFINNGDTVISFFSDNIWNSTEEIAYIYNGSTYTNYLGNYWSDYSGSDNDSDGIGDTPYSIYSNNDTYLLMQPWENYFATVFAFDTGPGTYPSLMGTHTGIILPSHNLNVSKLYTYPCAGTGGHTESIKLYENSTLIANGTWTGYLDEDWHNITLHNVTDGAHYVTLLQDHNYNYTIVTGSYPQILHATSKEVTGGTITCSSFVDANGNIYTDWIPAIKFF